MFRPVARGGSGGSIEPPILGSVCCACANMLPLLITENIHVGGERSGPTLSDCRIGRISTNYKAGYEPGPWHGLHTSVFSPRYARLCRRGAASRATLLDIVYT